MWRRGLSSLLRTVVTWFKLSNSLGNTVNSVLTISDEEKYSRARDINILVDGIFSTKSVLLEGILMMVFQNIKLLFWSLAAAEIQHNDNFTKTYKNGHIYLWFSSSFLNVKHAEYVFLMSF